MLSVTGEQGPFNISHLSKPRDSSLLEEIVILCLLNTKFEFTFRLNLILFNAKHLTD